MRFMSRRAVAASAAGVALLAGGGTALANGGFGFIGFGGGGSQTTVLNAVASNLNVSPTALRKAIEDALKAQVDRQVADGLVTSAEAAAIKERIDSGGVSVGAGAPRLGALSPLDLLEAAAAYLDMTPAALREQLAAGNSLADVVKTKSGKTTAGLQDAIVARATTVLAAAVAAGDLTDGQRDAALTRIKNSVDEIVAGTGGRFGLRGDLVPGPTFGGFRHR